MSYVEQFTAFIDFLGITEATVKSDEKARSEILRLLLQLSMLRGEFNIQSEKNPTGKTTYLYPAVSTFSDHVVMSYQLGAIRSDESDESLVAIAVLHHFTQLLTRLAAAALKLGFLIRGGATIGMLHHENGVVFGEALIDAYKIESRTAIYPRVVLSSNITSRQSWMKPSALWLTKDDDGLYYANYFMTLFNAEAPPGELYKASVGKWFDAAVVVISENLRALEKEGRLNELAKWTWFARKFRAALERLPMQLRDVLGLSIEKITWSA